MPQREQWEQQLFWQLCDECKFNRQGVCLAACKQNQSIEQMIADPAKWCPTYRWQQRLEYGAC